MRLLMRQFNCEEAQRASGEDPEPLTLDEEAVLQLFKLPALHRDPFARMLVCQAIAHGLGIVTPEAAIANYPVRTPLVRRIRRC